MDTATFRVEGQKARMHDLLGAYSRVRRSVGVQRRLLKILRGSLYETTGETSLPSSSCVKGQR